MNTGLAQHFAAVWGRYDLYRCPKGGWPKGVVYRNLLTSEGRAFWDPSSRAAEVAMWPDWKRAGINV